VNIGLEAEDRHVGDQAELALALREGGAGNVDRVVADRLPKRQRLEHETRLLAAARAELGDDRRGRQARHDHVGGLAQEAGVGARQAVFGEHGDRLE
jgi:hypothetical protein